MRRRALIVLLTVVVVLTAAGVTTVILAVTRVHGTPEDVARCLVDLSRPGTQWLTGCVVNVDGGEDVAG